MGGRVAGMQLVIQIQGIGCIIFEHSDANRSLNARFRMLGFALCVVTVSVDTRKPGP